MHMGKLNWSSYLHLVVQIKRIEPNTPLLAESKEPKSDNVRLLAAIQLHFSCPIPELNGTRIKAFAAILSQDVSVFSDMSVQLGAGFRL
jgi:hypothetical protein